MGLGLYTESSTVINSNPIKAAFWMVGAMISFTLMAIAGRSLAGHLDTFEIMLYRSILGIAIVTAVAWKVGTLGQINASKAKLHIVRNVCHFTGQNLWLFAVALIPLSQLFAFEFSTPLWVALLAPFVLQEKWTVTRVMVVVIGFIGVLIVARPDIAVLNRATVAAALCAVGFAGTVLSTKILARTETVTCILFWLVCLQGLFGLVCAGYDGEITMLNSQTWYWAALVGVCGLVAHFCITNALQIAPATVVTPLEFLRLPLIAVIGYMLYDEPLLLSVFVGAFIIFIANVVNLRAESKIAASTVSV